MNSGHRSLDAGPSIVLCCLVSRLQLFALTLFSPNVSTLRGQADERTTDSYITNFQWDEAKFPKNASLPDLCDVIRKARGLLLPWVAVGWLVWCCCCRGLLLGGWCGVLRFLVLCTDWRKRESFPLLHQICLNSKKKISCLLTVQLVSRIETAMRQKFTDYQESTPTRQGGGWGISGLCLGTPWGWVVANAALTRLRSLVLYFSPFLARARAQSERSLAS